MIKSYEIFVSFSTPKQAWFLTVTALKGSSETIQHERTKRTYDSPDDAVTSARHLIKELNKGNAPIKEPKATLVSVPDDSTAEIRNAVNQSALVMETRYAKNLTCRDQLQAAVYRGAIAALQSALRPDNSDVPDCIDPDWVKTCLIHFTR